MPNMESEYLEVERLLGLKPLIPVARWMLEWIWVRRSRGFVTSVYQAVCEKYLDRSLRGDDLAKAEAELRGPAKMWERTLEDWKIWAGSETGRGSGLGSRVVGPSIEDRVGCVAGQSPVHSVEMQYSGTAEQRGRAGDLALRHRPVGDRMAAWFDMVPSGVYSVEAVARSLGMSMFECQAWCIEKGIFGLNGIVILVNKD